MQRSGSGWFETLLNNHTNISSNGEIFSVKVRRSNMSTIVETLDKIYNLDWSSSASKNECTAAVGLKWMLNQVSHGLSMVIYFNICNLKSCTSLVSWVTCAFLSVHILHVNGYLYLIQQFSFSPPLCGYFGFLVLSE